MNDVIRLSRQTFIECNLRMMKLENEYCYLSLTSSLNNVANEMENLGRNDCAQTLKFLSKISSMSLVPDSINIPFKPMYEDYWNGGKTIIPDDLNETDLQFFEEILEDIGNPYLKARLADLLWLLKSPRKPIYATTAIDTYSLAEINEDTWHKGVNIGIERAARLCLQVRDQERLNTIRTKLHLALSCDYIESKFMNLWVANLMDKLNIDHDIRGEIANRLLNIANSFKEKNDFYSAEAYFKLAAKKFQQLSDPKSHALCLVSMAECLEQEADSIEINNNLVANSIYENALQAYRKIPNRYRDIHGIETRIEQVRRKITSTGRAATEEMTLFQTEKTDISEIVQSAINHVKGKQNPFISIIFFVGLSPEPNYDQIYQQAKDSINQSFFSTLFGGRHMSNDGRLIAKTPPIDPKTIIEDSINSEALHGQIQQLLLINIQLTVQGLILPALHQLCLEHRFTKELFIEICQEALLVPDDRVYLTANALWMGFEREFGLALHFICPQLEHIVRLKLKEGGAHTSTINNAGIETENGLSTIMDLPEAEVVFGKNLAFEISSLFTDPLGFNLRNQVAHGLLNDINASHSDASIYAWWMFLRMIVDSIPLRNEST